MSLSTGTNTVKLEVIDEQTGKIGFRAEWLGMDYAHTVALEEAFATSSLALGKAIVAEQAAQATIAPKVVTA